MTEGPAKSYDFTRFRITVEYVLSILMSQGKTWQIKIIELTIE